MTANCDRIGALIAQIQQDFLEIRGLKLTVPQAQKDFHITRTECEAILNALADARVLAKTDDGAYVRFFPHRAGRAGTPSRASQHRRNDRTHPVVMHAA